jgi:hypothetical protein
MFKNIQMHIDKAQLTGTGLKNLILDHLPETLFGQMHTTDRKGKSDQEIIEIILKAGRTVKMCCEARTFFAQKLLRLQRNLNGNRRTNAG